MCGIAGVYKLNKASVTTDELKKMTDVIVHRGPDGGGHWINVDGNIGFGHRRLSIIDLSDNAKQPMHYADGRYTITFNGEIYNYIEIKEQLVQKGYKFRSSSDTEVLLALYHLKKEKCLVDLDGMFAFAIWDEQEKILFCARDRFGEKPFHYYQDINRFIFASEIKQFWEAGIPKVLDQEKLLKYVNIGLLDDPEDICSTFYKNIKRLDAAHYLLISPDRKTVIKKYWDIDLNAKQFSGSIEDASEKFLNLFTESIRLRLRSDVPVGSSLSGGLDSSSIVMLIDALKGKELKQNTFSARFKDFSKDEGRHIETVVNACKNVDVHYSWPDKDYFEKLFDKVTYHQDEPFASASIIAQFSVMELAKERNVTILLDGQGADEQLGGYVPNYHYYLRQLNYVNPSLFRQELSAYKKFHHEAVPYEGKFPEESLRMKLGRHRRKILGQKHPFHNHFNTYLKYSTTGVGLKELLRYADRNSMANSREVRLPFLSHKLVEFVFSLPDEFKINSGWTKFVLRKAMDKILPSSICWRVDKIGYEPPQKNWMQSEKFNMEIEKASKFLDIIRINEADKKEVFTRDWRLLMAAQYI
ncbi:MAG: asparagine synthase (glutamine-hydrolyzing) [Bacteroidetes bacterium]|nr:MAG: asparagine synthase (glutamine-hydrolyzing) [Bacteroidota bacterium]